MAVQRMGSFSFAAVSGLVLAGLTLASPPAHAGAVAQPIPSQQARVASDASQRAARAITRITLLDLRLQPEPTSEDLRIADIMLSYAADLAPGDAELLRRRIEVASRLGDEAALLARTRELIKLDPQDTVAQLRLISMTLGRIQTAEARLEATKRFLGAAGAQLEGSIRSQLALDAALLAREIGDMNEFVSLLSRATELDNTNKEAAALAAAFYASVRPDDLVGIAESQLDVLLADPVDPQVMVVLARLGARAGSWGSVATLHRAARDLLAQDGSRAPSWIDLQRLVLDWHIEGPRVPVQELSTQVQSLRQNARVRIAELQREGLPTSDVTPPNELNLPPLAERLRVLAADAANDGEEVTRGLTDFALTIRRLGSEYEEEVASGRLTAEQARDSLRTMNLQRFLLHAIVDENFEQVNQAVQQAGLLEDAAFAPAFEGWVSLRTGNADRAIEQFEAVLASIDEPTAAIGLGQAYEVTGRVDDAVEMYRLIFQRNPLSIEAAWARSRAWSAAQVDVSQREDSDAMAAVLSSVPGWIVDAARSPLAFMTLDAELVDSALGPDEPVLVRLRLRNIAPIPIGVGPDRPISSRIVLVPQLEVGAQGRDDTTPSEPIDLAQRLRLKPREAIETEVWASPGYTGWVMQTRATRATRVRFRVLQNYIFRGTSLAAGPLALQSETESGVRGQLPGLRQSASQLVERMRLIADDDVGEMAVTLRALAFAPEDERRSERELAVLGSAWAQTYPKISPAGRIVMLAETPHASLAPLLASFRDRVRELLPVEPEDEVLAVGLLAYVSVANDPLLDLPTIEQSPRLRELRDLLRNRLAGEGPSYSRANDRLTSLLGSGVPGRPQE